MFQDELARSGRKLFVIRGHFIRLLIFIGIGIAYQVRSLGPFSSDAANCVWFWSALAIAATGALYRMYVNGHAANGTSSRIKEAAEAAELNTTGAYSMVRNPLYLGRILNFTGLAMLTGSAFYGMLIFFTSVLIYERISAYEENFLKEKFGAAHAKWAADVPALLPRFHGWTKPKYAFWWRRMFWREYKKVYQFGTALFFYEFARHGFDIEWLRGEPAIYISYGVLTLLRIGCKGLKMSGFFADFR